MSSPRDIKYDKNSGRLIILKETSSKLLSPLSGSHTISPFKKGKQRIIISNEDNLSFALTYTDDTGQEFTFSFTDEDGIDYILIEDI